MCAIQDVVMDDLRKLTFPVSSLERFLLPIFLFDNVIETFSPFLEKKKKEFPIT